MKKLSFFFLFIALCTNGYSETTPDVVVETKVLDKIVAEAASTSLTKSAEDRSEVKNGKQGKKEVKQNERQENDDINSAKELTPIDTRTAEEKAADLKAKQDTYDSAKETEQSVANRALGTLTTAATGLGGMELAQGLSEKKADAAAEKDMAAYIATMRCTYGNGKSVQAGTSEIELPGGNDTDMMNLRSEYFALADSLKSRKESLGMKPGIESEVVLDKADMNLYAQENTGITGGNESSLYRAKMLNSESDKTAIDNEQEKSQKRLAIGATVAGVGIVGGLVGNSIINGKLGDLFKDGSVGKETRKLLKDEANALADLKKCLKSAGVINTDDLSFTNFFPSILSVKSIDCKKDLALLKGKSAQSLFADSTDATKIYDVMDDSFQTPVFAKMVGSSTANRNSIIAKIESSIKSVQEKFKDADEKDKKSALNVGIDLGQVSSETLGGSGLKDLSSVWLDDDIPFNLMDFR